MKRIIFTFLYSLFVILNVFTLSACGNEGTSSDSISSLINASHENISSSLEESSNSVVSSEPIIEEKIEFLPINMIPYDAGVRNYETKEDLGYIHSNKLTTLPFDEEYIFDLKLSYSKSNPISIFETTEYNYYGITDSSVGLYASLNMDKLLENSEWEFSDDEWGKNEVQTILGSKTGRVGKGAILIQINDDGDWHDADRSKYADGLYTTDFYNSGFDTNENILIYTPSGEDLVNGVRLRVVFAYELVKPVECSHKFLGIKKHKNDNEYMRVLEIAEFELRIDNIDAIAFHNLTIKDQLTQENLGVEASELELYQKSETLTHNSLTVTGFEIDNSLNKTVLISLFKNDELITIPTDYIITENGKYTIKMKDVFGHTKEVDIYVDKDDQNSSFEKYFGSNFIDGKRIYSEGEYPVFEGGLTKYIINSLDNSTIPLTGTIVNLSTNDIIPINPTREGCEKQIFTPGIYQATLETGFDAEHISGDIRKYTFRFEIIELGTAPGPVINEKNLEKYIGSNVTDYNPIYYGVTFPSAGKGNITLAFADYKSAYDYSYNSAKGNVEIQDDGSYRYTGTFAVGQKVKYDNNWDLTDAVHYFATLAVQKLYFDMSDPFTYTTLSKETIENTKNLRTLELSKSVVIAADEEQRTKLVANSKPIINKKIYTYLPNGLDATAVIGYNDFEMIKDKNGYDSSYFTITDCNGNIYSNLVYNKGLGEQLDELNCPTGIIEIKEYTCYGDINEYSAVYFANEENTTTIKLNYHLDGEELSKNISKTNAGINIKANFFSFNSIVDQLDPYSLIKIVSGSKEEYYTIEELSSTINFIDVGHYDIYCINRIGNTYNFSIDIEESLNVYIAIEGSEEIISTQFGQTNVQLPSLTKYGYNHKGYIDSAGIQYTDEIAIILYKANQILTPIWEAKKFQLIYKTESGTESKEILFGEEYELSNPSVSEEYEFVCWVNDGKEIIDNKILIEKEGNINLVAKTRKVKSKIKIDSSNGSIVNEKLYSIGSLIHLEEPVREGYEFDGWYVNGEKIVGTSYLVTEDNIVISAKWKVKSSNNETGNNDDKNNENNKAILDLNDPKNQNIALIVISSIVLLICIIITVINLVNDCAFGIEITLTILLHIILSGGGLTLMILFTPWLWWVKLIIDCCISIGFTVIAIMYFK